MVEGDILFKAPVNNETGAEIVVLKLQLQHLHARHRI
jgi:hypothetical protein